MEEQTLPTWNRLEVARQEFLCEVVLPMLATHGVAVQRQTELTAKTLHASFDPLWSPLGTRYLHPRTYVGALHSSAQF